MYCVQQWHTLGYFLIALGIFIEGDAVLYTAGFLSHRGILDPWLAFIWLLGGATIGDVAWYKLGAYLEPKDTRVVRWLKHATNPLGPHLTDRPRRSLFISKFLYGINHAILCKAGALHIPLKRFMRIDLPANLAWILVVGGLGYASSAGFSHVRKYLHYGELGLLLGIILLMILSRLFAHFFKKKL
jgi:membrane protein DedA with SNARE-associated domain